MFDKALERWPVYGYLLLKRITSNNNRILNYSIVPLKKLVLKLKLYSDKEIEDLTIKECWIISIIFKIIF